MQRTNLYSRMSGSTILLIPDMDRSPFFSISIFILLVCQLPFLGVSKIFWKFDTHCRIDYSRIYFEFSSKVFLP